MLDSQDISRLYENVLQNDVEQYNIPPEAVKFGIECMAHVYGEITGLSAERSKIADYSDPAQRCAYLHKYAALHTALVRDMLLEAVRKNFDFFQKLINSGEQLKLCSLGGGPGTDVIGSLATLHAAFGDFDTSVTVVDYMHEWSLSFDSILKEIGNGNYGAFGNNLSYYLRWRYVRANLLKAFNTEVLEALSTASLVTMIKFISAAACMDTYSMIRDIFTRMKPGALLLFIDNDGGGFHNLIVDAAVEFGFESKFGPLRQETYINNIFKKKRFGYCSCCQTTVTVHLLQKPLKTIPCYNFPNSHEPRYRRVVIDDNFSSTKQSLVSPPTPFLYLGHPDENCNNFISIRPTLLISITPASSTTQCPQIPLSHEHRPDENDNCIDCASAHEMGEIPHPSPRNVIIPSCIATPNTSEVVNSPYRTPLHRQANFTPDTQPRGKRAHTGCLPLRISKLGHHLSNRFNQFKAHAHSYFRKKKKKNKKKKKKNHPIFKL